jgi:asparagine synthase (glutamine-hydrolysing)
MCGVFGCLGFIGEEQVSAALEALAHRGPNGQGIWQSTDRDVTLGHRRLSIIAPNNGAQPIANEDGSVIAVVNGELYDFQRVRRALKEKGHSFRTESDSEILIHLYEEHGVECLRYVRGEFAFVLWDARRKKLFCARDRFGIKPLVLSVLPNRVLVASEAKALLKAGVPARIDMTSVGVALRQQYLPEGRTVFEGIEQLPRAHAVVFQFRDGAIERTQWPYWSLPLANLSTELRREAVIERVQELLSDAVRQRLVADVSVGVYLSGGIDSASVLGLMCKHGSRPVGFSVTTGDALYSELEDTRASALFHGTNLEEVCASPLELLEHVGKAVYYAEGMAINGHLPAKYLLSERARRYGVPVVLSGEGSDELFLGYPHFALDAAIEQGRSVGELAALLECNNPTAKGLMISAKYNSRALPHFYQTKLAYGERMSELFNLLHRDTLTHGALSLDEGEQHESLRNAHRAWIDLALSNYILRTLGDGTEMAHSIEGRTPFLDHLLWEGLAEVPLRAWVDPEYGGGKSILRDAVAGLVPEEVRCKPKRPFVLPPLSLDSSLPEGRRVWELSLDHVAPFFSRNAIEMVLRDCAASDLERRKEYDPVLFTIITGNALCREFELGQA